ncbi:hypothetical protein AWZ03_012067 [Drosophila navojoa]|uniref:Uncharacterized protein n=1 Tax=Drosophila navojoa TaxID=7232 RepID=A0A484B101_DRONA|nr:hypothetical protein AWZ03_012067 [Drosophila navojoa]
MRRLLTRVSDSTTNDMGLGLGLFYLVIRWAGLSFSAIVFVTFIIVSRVDFVIVIVIVMAVRVLWFGSVNSF